MIYLDNAATTMPKPPEVLQAVHSALLTCAGLGRSGHEAARKAAEIAFDCRDAAGELFETDPEQVVFTLNATHGLNIAIRTLVHPGDTVVVSGYEHNSVLRPLYALGARIIPVTGKLFDPESMLEDFDRAITPSVKAVVCCHVSNVFGGIAPLEEIAAICRDRNVALIVDAAQSAGILPISLQKLGAAFIAMPGHKGLYGPQGTGLLLCGQKPEPFLYGGTGSLSRSPEMPPFLPDRAEAGTQNMPGIAGLLAGIRFVSQMGPNQIRNHEKRLLNSLNRQLRTIPGIQTYYSSSNQTGVLSFTVQDMDCERLGGLLSDQGFAVRAGLHCAPLAHRSAGTLQTGTVRVSFSAYNTLEETNRFAETVEELLSGAR